MYGRYWIGLNTALARANGFGRSGLISEREWRCFEIAWVWGAERFSGAAGSLHDAYTEQRGIAAYYRRINRMRRACGLPEYPTRPEWAS